jgi:hypothetical protein
MLYLISMPLADILDYATVYSKFSDYKIKQASVPTTATAARRVCVSNIINENIY